MSSLFNARVTNFPPITGRTKHTINPSSRQLQIVLKGHMPVPLDISTLRFFGSCGDILCHCIATTHLLLGRHVQPRLAARAASHHRSFCDLRPGFRACIIITSLRVFCSVTEAGALHAKRSVTTYEWNNNAPMRGDI